MKFSTVSVCAWALAMVLAGGCASVQRSTPTAPGLVNINLEKGDFTMLGTVKGTSTVKSYFLGFVQVIDGDKTKILCFKSFEDQYSIQPGGFGFLAPVSVADRAYYKALAATPDADAVIPKAFVKQTSGFPLFWFEESVTFSGKALKYKSE